MALFLVHLPHHLSMSYLHCLFFDQTILITEAKLQMKAEVNFANEYKVVSSLNKEFYFCTADIKKNATRSHDRNARSTA